MKLTQMLHQCEENCRQLNNRYTLDVLSLWGSNNGSTIRKAKSRGRITNISTSDIFFSKRHSNSEFNTNNRFKKITVPNTAHHNKSAKGIFEIYKQSLRPLTEKHNDKSKEAKFIRLKESSSEVKKESFLNDGQHSHQNSMKNHSDHSKSKGHMHSVRMKDTPMRLSNIMASKQHINSKSSCTL